MATRKANQPPAGFTKKEAAAPEGAFELEIGEQAVGILEGPARPSKMYPDRRFRMIRTSEGTYFLNGSAKLEQLGVMDMPAGTRLWICRGKDVKISGQANAMKDYEVATQNGTSGKQAEDNDLPF